MAKAKTVYTCTECGGTLPKWQGQCPHCNAWNTLVETIAESTKPRFAALAATSTVQLLHDSRPRRKAASPPTSANSTACSAAAWCRGAWC
jgi:DNA repair protein RadA/Sms